MTDKQSLRDQANTLFLNNKLNALADLLLETGLIYKHWSDADSTPNQTHMEQGLHADAAVVEALLPIAHVVIDKLYSGRIRFANKLSYLSDAIILPMYQQLFVLSSAYRARCHMVDESWIFQVHRQVKQIDVILRMVLKFYFEQSEVLDMPEAQLLIFIRDHQFSMLLQLQYINSIAKGALLAAKINNDRVDNRYLLDSGSRNIFCTTLLVIMRQALRMPIFRVEYIASDQINNSLDKLRLIAASSSKLSSPGYVNINKDDSSYFNFNIVDLQNEEILPTEIYQYTAQSPINKFALQMLLEKAIVDGEYADLYGVFSLMPPVVLRNWLFQSDDASGSNICVVAKFYFTVLGCRMRPDSSLFVEFLRSAFQSHDEDSGILHKFIRQDEFYYFGELVDCIDDVCLHHCLMERDKNRGAVLTKMLEISVVDRQASAVSVYDAVLARYSDAVKSAKFVDNERVIRECVAALRQADTYGMTLFDKLLAKDCYDYVYRLLSMFTAEYANQLLLAKLNNGQTLFAQLEQNSHPRLMKFIGYPEGVSDVAVVFAEVGVRQEENLRRDSVLDFYIWALKTVTSVKGRNVSANLADSMLRTIVDLNMIYYFVQLYTDRSIAVVQAASSEMVRYLLGNIWGAFDGAKLVKDSDASVFADFCGEKYPRSGLNLLVEGIYFRDKRYQFIESLVAKVGYDNVLWHIEDDGVEITEAKCCAIIYGLANNTILDANDRLREYVKSNIATICRELASRAPFDLDLLQAYADNVGLWLQEVVGRNNKDLTKLAHALEGRVALLPLRHPEANRSLKRLMDQVVDLKAKTKTKRKSGKFFEANELTWKRIIADIIFQLSGHVLQFSELGEVVNYHKYDGIRQLLFAKKILFAAVLLEQCEADAEVLLACSDKHSVLYAFLQEMPDQLALFELKRTEWRAVQLCYNKDLSYEAIIALSDYMAQNAAISGVPPVRWLHAIAANIRSNGNQGNADKETIATMRIILQAFARYDGVSGEMQQVVNLLLNSQPLNMKSSFVGNDIEKMLLSEMLPIFDEMVLTANKCDISEDTKRQSGYSIAAIRELIEDRDNIVSLYRRDPQGLYEMVHRIESRNDRLVMIEKVLLHLDPYKDENALHKCLDNMIRSVVSMYLDLFRSKKVEQFYRHFDYGYCLDGRFTSLLNWYTQSKLSEKLHDSSFVDLMQASIEEADNLAEAMGQAKEKLSATIEYIIANYDGVECQTDEHSAAYAPDNKITEDGVRRYLVDVLAYDEEDQSEEQNGPRP